jgi:hypothetical protein
VNFYENLSRSAFKVISTIKQKIDRRSSSNDMTTIKLKKHRDADYPTLGESEKLF